MKSSLFVSTVVGLVLFTQSAWAQSTAATLYAAPQCGCCQSYAEYLQNSGFDVEVVRTETLSEISREAGVPVGFQGCHTMLIEGYVVDGHVPVEVIRRLLQEKPDVAGISLPGMPVGSPGMSGSKEAPFIIYSFSEDGGAPTVYAEE
jgi:hypothetical protein